MREVVPDGAEQEPLRRAAPARADDEQVGSGGLLEQDRARRALISVLLWTTGRVADATREVEPEFWRRYLALLVDGLRTGSATPLPRRPLSAAQHGRAMTRLTVDARDLRADG